MTSMPLRAPTPPVSRGPSPLPKCRSSRGSSPLGTCHLMSPGVQVVRGDRRVRRLGGRRHARCSRSDSGSAASPPRRPPATACCRRCRRRRDRTDRRSAAAAADAARRRWRRPVRAAAAAGGRGPPRRPPPPARRTGSSPAGSVSIAAIVFGRRVEDRPHVVAAFGDDHAQALFVDAIGDADQRRHAGDRAALIRAVARRAVLRVGLLAPADGAGVDLAAAASAAAASGAGRILHVVKLQQRHLVDADDEDQAALADRRRSFPSSSLPGCPASRWSRRSARSG